MNTIQLTVIIDEQVILTSVIDKKTNEIEYSQLVEPTLQHEAHKAILRVSNDIASSAVDEGFNQSRINKYIDSFKTTLIRKYGWSISRANSFEDPKLYEAFREDLLPEEAYFKIFGGER